MHHRVLARDRVERLPSLLHRRPHLARAPQRPRRSRLRTSERAECAPGVRDADTIADVLLEKAPRRKRRDKCPGRCARGTGAVRKGELTTHMRCARHSPADSHERRATGA